MILFQNFSIRSFSHNVKKDFIDEEKANEFLESLGLSYRFKMRRNATFYHENGYYLIFTPPLERYAVTNKPKSTLNEIVEEITLNNEKLICIGRYTDKERFYLVKKRNNKPGYRLKRVFVRQQLNTSGKMFKYIQFSKKRNAYTLLQKLFDNDIGLNDNDDDSNNKKEKQILCVETEKAYTEKELRKMFSRYDFKRILKVLSGELPTAMSYHWKYID